MIVVFGATGPVGRATVGELVSRGVDVRAVSRDPVRAAGLLPRPAQVVRAELDDDASVAAAVRDADRVLALTPHHPSQLLHQRRIFRAAAAVGVGRIVKVSALAAAVSPTSPSPIARMHHQTESEIRCTRVPWTFVRPTPYMQNTLDYLEQGVRFGRLFLPFGDAPIAMVDARDVGAVCAAALLDDSGENRCLEVTGPEALRMDEVAVLLGQAFRGRRLGYRRVPPHVAAAIQRGRGVEQWMIQHQIGMAQHLASGAAARVTSTVAEMTGREPASYRAFLASRLGERAGGTAGAAAMVPSASVRRTAG